jgi:eukaryotic-like serine/threonine-protein kinase
MIGSKLAHYEITSHLGSGGMGEVYEATDLKLGRNVAIKFLPEAFSRDSERVARFQREGRVLASLNHPNIAAIHGVEEIEGRHFLVMELVPGETLAERIRRGAIPIVDALPIARQIAEALDEAHERGVIHRDLKPANIKVTPEGKVKVLDFGLAKIYEREHLDASLSNSPTRSITGTQAGVILGTAAYMAPEQVKATGVDKRADIWAFGVVLYEMVSGIHPFRGKDLTEVFASVLKDEPDVDTVPPNLRRLLRNCLEKEPRRRLRDIGDAWKIAEEPKVAGGQTSRLAWLAAGIFAAAAMVALWAPWRVPSTRPATLRIETAPPSGVVAANNGIFSVSPDGRQVLFAGEVRDGERGIFRWSLDNNEATFLNGSTNGTNPFWSADGQWAGFRSAEGTLRKVPIAGGLPQDIVGQPVGATSGTWNRDGVVIFQDADGNLSQVPANGGPTTVVVRKSPDDLHLELPVFLPDGRHFVYFRHSPDAAHAGIYGGSLDGPAEQGPAIIVATDGPAYMAGSNPEQGYLFFTRDYTLLAQRFDPVTLRVAGEPIVATASPNRGPVNVAAGVLSAGGDVIIHRATVGRDYHLTWFDDRGRRLGKIGEPVGLEELVLSPDGKRAAFRPSWGGGGSTMGRTAGTNWDLWVLDIDRNANSRLTFDPAQDLLPVWSADSTQILFLSRRSKKGDVYRKASNGAGGDELLYSSEDQDRPLDWSKDGQFVLVLRRETAGLSVVLLRIKAGFQAGDATVLKFDGGPIANAGFSPDGQWIWYVSAETGARHLYVRPFIPENPSAPVSAKWQVSREPVLAAPVRWRTDGKQIFFADLRGSPMTADISTRDGFASQAPRLVFKLPPGADRWDVTADGSRFLIATPIESSYVSPFTVILNWRE